MTTHRGKPHGPDPLAQPAKLTPNPTPAPAQIGLAFERWQDDGFDRERDRVAMEGRREYRR